jgi:hypothetical protein
LKCPFFPISSPSFLVICVIDDSHIDWSEVESQCTFDLHSPDEHFFIYLLTICISSLEMSVQIICPFIDWITCSFVHNFFEFLVYFRY